MEKREIEAKHIKQNGKAARFDTARGLLCWQYSYDVEYNTALAPGHYSDLSSLQHKEIPP
jgi:hypothetical protein